MKNMNKLLKPFVLMVVFCLAFSACTSAITPTAALTTVATTMVPTTEAATTAPTTGVSIDDLKAALGIPTGQSALAGMTFEIGASLPITGTSANQGVSMMNGINMAIQDIQLLGGPKFNVKYYDIQSGDIQKGLDAIRAMGANKNPAALVGWCAALDAQQPDAAKSHILMLDAGCGIGAAAWGGQPYFWGTRALDAYDPAIGVAEYIAAKMPNAKRVALLMEDYGASQDTPGGTIDTWTKAVQKQGLTFAGYVKVPQGSTDYTDAITKLKALTPDVIALTPVDGQPSAFFMKQYVTSGMTAQVFGDDYTQATAKLAGSAYDNYWFFGENYFPDLAKSVWSQWFNQEFEKMYPGQTSDLFTANYYEDAFAIWDLMRRVEASGGNPNDGSALQAALEANPVFSSVYGGDSKTVGVFKLDLGNHNVAGKRVYLCTIKNSLAIPFASFLAPSGENLEFLP